MTIQASDTRGILELAVTYWTEHAQNKCVHIPTVMAQFAESIVEQCCETICELCRNPNYGKPAYFKRHKFEDAQWWHMRTSPSETEKDNVLCTAAPIRSRWQRGEGT